MSGKYPIILMTHGQYCNGVKDGAEMVLGALPDVYTFPLLPGTSPEQYRDMVCQLLEKLSGTIYILTDLKGGTPANVACSLKQSYEVEVYSGLNLMMLIAADEFRLQDLNAEEFSQKLLQAVIGSICYLA